MFACKCASWRMNADVWKHINRLSKSMPWPHIWDVNSVYFLARLTLILGFIILNISQLRPVSRLTKRTANCECHSQASDELRTFYSALKYIGVFCIFLIKDIIDARAQMKPLWCHPQPNIRGSGT